MNSVQIQLEDLKAAAHRGRFDPLGKHLAKACVLIEKLETALRSVALGGDPEVTTALAKDILNQ